MIFVSLKRRITFKIFITTLSKSTRGYRYTINTVDNALNPFEVSLIKPIITTEINPPKKEILHLQEILILISKLKYNKRKDTQITITKRKLKLNKILLDKKNVKNENFINSNNASPSMPSVKLNEFTTVTINNIVRGWARTYGISKIPKIPFKSSISIPWSTIIFAAIIWNKNFNLKSESYISSYIPVKKSIPSGIKLKNQKFDYLLNIDRM